MGDLDDHLPAVMYSDVRGLAHNSLEDQAAAPLVSNATEERKAQRTRRLTQEPSRDAKPMTRRGGRLVKSEHKIMQAQPRALCH
jgi:hypothetical protein